MYHTASSQNSLDFPDSCRLPLTAKEVRDVRILLGYSQALLARALGVRQVSTISDWEQGISRPSPAMQAALRIAWRARIANKPLRETGDGTWEHGQPRRDAAAQWGRGERIGARPLA
jgi:transcriptional regulator with XRE-family HTH domain